jgi:hypothetical protein
MTTFQHNKLPDEDDNKRMIYSLRMKSDDDIFPEDDIRRQLCKKINPHKTISDDNIPG